MKEAEKIAVTDNTQTQPSAQPPKKKGRGLKAKFSCLIFIIGLLLICCGAFAVLWLGGFVQQSVCRTVVSGSQIYRSLECQNYTEEAGTGEYRYTQIVGDGNQTITGHEEVITNVFERSAPSVVAIGIRGNNQREDQVIGTGFIVTANGLIVTNRHVVEQDDTDYFVTLKDSEELIDVVDIHRDPVNDIALITIERSDLPALPLGDSEGLQQGQTVVAIGNPLGRFSGTVTSGIISGLNREVQISEGFFASGVETYEDVIQTDAAINPGNSGGPLLNSSGEVIGMNFATVSGADNLSFAIPINRVKNRIEELNEFGRFRIPFLGIEYRLRIVFVNGRSTVGAEILRVVDGAAADKAGILPGDIILEFDGNDLEEQSLFNLIQASEIGSQVRVGILRDGETFETTITVDERR
ncbi:MAG: putative periplasmic serine endoprotease DegP-like precursor [candidate division WS6 bacterium OLB20]|uniref:Putative periplasmic serine endoprotease DegP-like n=1 Tax=candidate division WS6 bacterium OLB20 TaxID=1617426 RepID=A0A136LY88_9BACT|nr:MAG: putative periplasmic serine endoprotease DegP-like precursor [candidate division WS6 bacterium OLB20]